jgi:hypothetical protein
MLLITKNHASRFQFSFIGIIAAFIWVLLLSHLIIGLLQSLIIILQASEDVVGCIFLALVRKKKDTALIFGFNLK